MKECCIFSNQSAEIAWQNFDFEVLERFGDSFRNPDGTCRQDIKRLDDGRCSFIRCKNCGSLFVYFFDEALVYYGADDDIYMTTRRLVSVADRDEAKLYASSRSEDIGGLRIEQNWGRWSWNK